MDYEKLWKGLKDGLWQDANSSRWFGVAPEEDTFDFDNPAQTFLDRMAKEEEIQLIKGGSK